MMSRSGTGADLIVVTLPRAGADSLDLHSLTRAMTAWRRLLRPGGHLIAALAPRGTAAGPEPGPEPGSVSHRSTVIAAARAAGLVYHQHLPVLLVPLPEHDPRTDPNPATDPDGRRLTVNETRRLINTLLIEPARDLHHRLRWSGWRRQHQARARRAHHERRRTLELQP